MDVKPTDLTVQQWEQARWSDLDKEPTFHRKEYSSSLVKYYSKLFPDNAPGRVFIPLCGKTLDLVYLADQGHEVVGLEFAEGAIERFHMENSLTYTKQRLDDVPFTVYSTKEKNIKIYQGDLFDMNSGICGQFDAVFDRGSFVAINVCTHKKYADLMSSIVKPGGAILMEAIRYTSATFGGPPHSISESDIRENFTNFDINMLETFDQEARSHIFVDDKRLIVTFVHLKRIP